MTIDVLHGDIRAAARGQLVAMMGAGIPAVADWEGVHSGSGPFVAPTGTPFFRERMRPLSSIPRGIGQGGVISHRIMLALTLFYPRGVTLEIEAAAGRLLAAFRPGTHLIRSASVATVVQAERGPITHEPDWQSLPVMITVLAYTAG